MKITLASDIHLEFGDIELKNTERADVLILSGDICVAADILRPDSKGKMVQDFFKRCSREFPHVIYIMGNHEHYHGDFATTPKVIRDMVSSLETKNFYFLDKETKVIDDVTFVGGTLWTDFHNENPITMQRVSRMMNDYVQIKNSNREVSFKTYDEYGTAKFKTRPSVFSTRDALDDHRAMMKFISETVDGKPHDRFVVVGHHAPSPLSTHPRYKSEHDVNGAYSSNLSDFILDRPQIRMWTHGHTHEPFDYMIGDTRIVCNPRGYHNYEQRADDFKLEYYQL